MRALTAIVAAFALLAPASALAAPTDPIQPADPAPYVLHDAGTWTRNARIVGELRKVMPRSSVALILRSADQRTRKLGSLPRVPSANDGYRWSQPDTDDPTWFPQGITTSDDATADGKWGANKVQLVGWDAKGARQAEGSRISFVNANHLGRTRYQHVLLVEPIRAPDGTASYRRVPTHAGGLAWYGPYIYVADTKRVRVFDLRLLLATTSQAAGVGAAADGKFSAAGYKYVLPQVSTYRIGAGTDPSLLFSFVSVDRTTTPHSLVTGEFKKDPGGRLLRWPLDAPSNRLAGGADVHASEAFVMPQNNVQGAVSVAGRFHLSANRGVKGNGTLTSDVPGQPTRAYSWGRSPEDLTYAPLTGQLLGLTERLHFRAVFAVPAAAFP